MQRIRVLSDDVVAAISAGEVVERPLSVVKELVDNAIDADADRIEITIEDGGKSYIEVRDNGFGISEEDLKLCLLKHATSKISAKEDLFNIKTMGFRGEALYSISQVSELTMTSKQNQALVGHKLVARGGKVISLSESGCPQGTTVSVSDLFFNLPVRKKFLKSANWERSLIVEFIQQISLLYPAISFILRSDRKDLVVLNKCNDKSERVKQLFPGLINNLMYNKTNYNNYSGEVFVSLPDLNMQNFYLFSVNGRPVKDKIFYKVLQDIYSGQRKKPPFIYVDLKMPENEVDVNVHPTKKEVKFLDNNRVYNFLRELLDNSSKEEREEKPLRAEKIILSKVSFKHSDPLPLLENKVQESIAEYTTTDNNYRIIGTFAKGFLLLEKDDKLLIIDQHAAHERLIFDRLMSDYKKQCISPQMIIPYVFTIKRNTAELLEELKEPLKNLGFSYEQVAPESFAVTSIPPLVSFDTGIKTFLELIENRECLKNYSDIIYSSIATLACKEAVKKTDLLKEDEIQYLLNSDLFNNKHYCPHGRNFIIEITAEELEKRFGRKD